MTEKASIFKLILVIILIVITPLLFFRTIGDNPLKVVKTENATKSIAIINEDIGTQEADEKIQFGQDVASILAESSNFEWTVVGRSAGENGLRNLKYDAIVYMPSDFSENIMTYDEANPVKTNFQYKVQSQLNAVNKEKVLVELEKATKRVNQKISSLYWNYISADMEHIRQEFDEILQKEVAFQETMTAFYKPSSKNLAGQIDEQKAMLTSLQSSIQQIGERTPEQQATMEGYEQNLETFVEYVEQYKEYQAKQQILLAEIQANSIQSVNQATEDQQPLFIKSTSLFEDEGNTFIESMAKLDSRMENTQQVFGQLEEQRYSQVGRQISEFYKLQEKILEFYQQLKDTTLLNDVEGQLATLSDQLSVGEEPEEPEEPTEEEKDNPGKSDEKDQKLVTLNTEENSNESGNHDETPGEDTTDQVEPEMPLDPEKPEQPNDPKVPVVDFESEMAELTSISEELTRIKAELTNLVDPKPEEMETSLSGLGTINDRILALKTALDTKETDKNPLEDDLKELQDSFNELLGVKNTLDETIANKNSQIQQLEDDNKQLIEDNLQLETDVDNLEEIKSELETELTLYKDYETNIKEEIEKKEKSILASKALSETRKEHVNEIFSKDIKSKDLLQMMFYFSYLDRYEATLNSMLAENTAIVAVLGNEELQQEANKIAAITSEEQSSWDQLGKEMPTNQDALNTLEDGFTVFMAEYRQTVDEQQAKLVESLDGILQEATTVLDQIKQPDQMLTVVEPTTTVEGQEMVSGTERISEQMESIHTWMDSVGESQSSIIEYTGELQVRVSDVQVDADKLNDKWASNVSSTELIRDDVFSVLGNTFVDGQSNGYVYDFLTNPLKISGDIPEETESTTVKNIPPVVVLFIVLVCSLLIGYTSYYFQQPPLWIQGILFVLLTLIVGFVISLFGLDIYPLREESAVEWTVFTILLLAAGSALVRVSFTVHHLVGLFITVGMVIFYVTPLLALTTPNFTFSDPMSNVYMSIQYGTDSLFTQAVMILALILAGLGMLQYFIEKARTSTNEKGSETHAM
ncbi:type VII secretion protein EsaA [Metabacillus bambusae]|uniref:Type VII secretion protein EsaA n=1 Tax=Metabacillus bambusae TaxID=2795218 RepID=A0ABS3N343_9BACI|nr:type VII secretion protein EsaA [Metabacillus bambusae]MBO1512687.1 type VII secretion protein EsaA [Metabacillus bambusae]